MPRFQARGLCWILISRFAWSLYKCEEFCRAVYGAYATSKDPLELFVKRGEFLRVSGFLSRRDMTRAVESHVETISFFLPFYKRSKKYVWPRARLR